MKNIKLKITNNEKKILAEDCNLIEDKTTRAWALKYLKGHIAHYNGILVQLEKGIKLSKNYKILEIGSVPGQLTSFLKIKGFEIASVDIEPERIEEIFNKYNIENFKVDIEKELLPIPDESFDIILFNEVFEHLHINPLKVLQEINRVLTKNGILLMSVPNINPLMRWEFLFGIDYNDNLTKEFAKLDSIGHMGHFRLYSDTEIKDLLNDFDFEVLEESIHGNVYDRKSKWLKLFKILFKSKMKNQYHVVARKK